MASDHITKFVSDNLNLGKDGATQQLSAYLCARCPLCFSGNDWQQHCDPDEKVDCIFCLDACFTQKHSNNPWNGRMQDPPNPTPMVFIPKCDVKVMEDHIRDCHSGGSGTRKQQREPVGEVCDGYEVGMKIPVSVLDGCSELFAAADEKHQKASMHFFVDTGLMVLLCRHDQVLWLVNMMSAGKKQHYALALVK
ncbi:hypothetical protein BDR04DRAFT_1117049 [Suillus decipiens]|nr:hypothetical protein BDR04DRAFT_1117049 [Suillus decipiens]